jgi:hypothetical protein
MEGTDHSVVPAGTSVPDSTVMWVVAASPCQLAVMVAAPVAVAVRTPAGSTVTAA